MADGAIRRLKLVANLPYNVATPLVLRTLVEVDTVTRLLVMVLGCRCHSRIRSGDGRAEWHEDGSDKAH